MNRLIDLYPAIRFRIIQEPIKMEDEYGWKDLDVHLPARPS